MIMKATLSARAGILAVLLVGLCVGGCGKDKAGIIEAKVPDRFYDLEETKLPATVGVTAIPYVDLGGDQSIRLADFLRTTEVFKKVRLVETPYAPGCDVIVGGVLQRTGDHLQGVFRIYKGGVPQPNYVCSIPWNPKGAGKEDVEGVYLSFNGVWARLAIHLADNVLKIGPKDS